MANGVGVAVGKGGGVAVGKGVGVAVGKGVAVGVAVGAGVGVGVAVGAGVGVAVEVTVKVPLFDVTVMGSPRSSSKLTTVALIDVVPGPTPLICNTASSIGVGDPEVTRFAKSAAPSRTVADGKVAGMVPVNP